MSLPPVSIVIPSYNHCRFVGAAVESALVQTHAPREVIVVDDGSLDDSPEFLRRHFGGKIELISQQNRGAHSAINLGISRAQSPWIAILNSDDLYAKDRLHILLEEAQRGSFDVVFSQLQFIDEKGRVLDHASIARRYERQIFRRLNLPILDALLLGNFAVTSSNLIFCRAVLQRLVGFRPFRYCHDWDFLLRASASANVGWVREPLLYYRWHTSNTLAEYDPWRLETENALVYVSLLFEPSTHHRVSSELIFEAEPFEPILFALLAVEASQTGVGELVKQANCGILHHRVAKVMQASGIKLKKRAQSNRSRTFPARLKMFLDQWLWRQTSKNHHGSN